MIMRQLGILQPQMYISFLLDRYYGIQAEAGIMFKVMKQDQLECILQFHLILDMYLIAVQV